MKRRTKISPLKKVVGSEVVSYNAAENGTFIFRGRVCIPDDKGLKYEIM